MKWFLFLISMLLMLFSFVAAQDLTYGTVVAEVNGQEITVGEFFMELNRLTPEVRSGIIEDPNGKTEVLNLIIRKKLLTAEAKKLKVDTLNAVKIEIYRYAQEVYAQYLLDITGRNAAKCTEEEAKQFYDNNDTLFKIPNTYHLMQIILPKESEAKDVIKKLKSGKLDWDEAIKNYPGITGMASGDAGWAAENRLVPEYKDKIISIKTGDIDGPFKIGEGYFVIKMVEKEKARDLTFEESKDRIIQVIGQQRARGAVEELKSKLWMQSKHTIDNAVLQKIPLNP